MGLEFNLTRIKWVLAVLFGFLLVVITFVLSPFPKKDFISGNPPYKFSVPIHSGFEIQGKNQCAAYSSAFVLRNFGQSAKGSEVYDELSFKIPISGYVLPKGVISNLQTKGLNPKIIKGIWSHLSKGLSGDPTLSLYWLGMVFIGSII